MRVLITGVTGFAGSHLARRLLDAGHDVCGWSRGSAWPAREALGLAGVVVEPTDWQPATLRVGLERDRPDAIAHLAGYAHAGRSFREADVAWHGNLTCTRHLFDAVAAVCPAVRLLMVSTGQVYGVPTEAAIDERQELLPNNPYAASKAAADLLAYQVTKHPGLNVVRARPFNHIGPWQSADYAASSFARQIARIHAGIAPPVLETGDLSSERDLLDVRDIAEAYRLLLERGRVGEAYNVGSGVAVSMREVVEVLRDLAGVSIAIHTAADRLRPVDAPRVVCDASKLRRETGWQPALPLRRSLTDLLAHWIAISATE